MHAPIKVMYRQNILTEGIEFFLKNMKKIEKTRKITFFEGQMFYFIFHWILAEKEFSEACRDFAWSETIQSSESCIHNDKICIFFIFLTQLETTGDARYKKFPCKLCKFFNMIPCKVYVLGTISTRHASFSHTTVQLLLEL